MDLLIRERNTRIYTGGRPFNREQPAVVLIHGAGHDHSVWTYQARHLAHRGYAVVAPDLPGHGASDGPALDSIDSLADWIVDLLDGLGLTRVSLVGHSMGSLIALAVAGRAAQRIDRLILVGSVAPMPVAPMLIEAARTDRDRAHAMINQWSYTPTGQLGASSTPGMSLIGLNRSLMAHQQAGVLAADLQACNDWQDGLRLAADIPCPTLLICGERDQMTPPRAVKPLYDALVNSTGHARMMVLPGTGHAMMAESPDALSNAIREFLVS